MLEQFAEITRQRALIGEAQQPLLNESNAIKQQLKDFSETQNAIQVSCGDILSRTDTNTTLRQKSGMLLPLA